MNTNYSELQNLVIAKAKREVEGERWYNGLCVDKLPYDFEIEQMGVDAAVEILVVDTMSWDAVKDLL